MVRILKKFFIPCEENDFKPRILGFQVFFVLLGFLVGIKLVGIFSYSSLLGADIFNQISQDDLYTLTNKARIENGVNQLNVNSKLEVAAQLKLNDMFQNNYFAHISPTGIEPWDWFNKSNYDYKLAGENLAMNFLSSNEVLKAWLSSESHRNNLLLKDFKEIGIAIGSGLINGQKTIVVVQEFGTSRISAVKAPVIKPVVKPVIVSVSPKPQNVVPKPSVVIKKSNPVSLKQIAIVEPISQVKAAITGKTAWSEYGGYFANNNARNIIIVFVTVAFLALILKVFVAFRIQFPALIFRSILLIAISIAFLFVKDSQFFTSKIKITDRAEIKTILSR